MARERVSRPRGGSLTFACVPCALVLHDGVDYTWCPRCGLDVDWIDASRETWSCARCDVLGESCACGGATQLTGPLAPLVPPKPTTTFATARWIYGWLVVAVLAIDLIDPDNEIYVRPALLALQLGSLVYLALVALHSREIRALARHHEVRILHGLEHATLKLLEERGMPVRSGRTFEGFFLFDVFHDGRSWERVDDIARAARDAVARIVAGDRALALDPRCGTSWLVARTLVALAIAGAGIVGFVADLPAGVVAAMTMAMWISTFWISRPLGLLAQRTLTVSTDLARATVQRVSRRVMADAYTIEFAVYIEVVPRARGVAAISPTTL